jgi:hypothetical protein|tara:strand:+ start:207 stop:389 length:183 start_codon:yes stop_codon:yes gene_type:complete
VFLLILHDEIWRLPFSEISGKQSVCTNIEHDALAEYCFAIDGTRSGTNNLRVQNTPANMD